MEEVSSREFVVEAFRPQRQHLGGADVDATVQQVGSDCKVRAFLENVGVHLEVVALLEGVNLVVLETPAGVRVDDKDWLDDARVFCPVAFRAEGPEDHGHAGIAVRLSPCAVLCEGVVEGHIGDQIAVDEEEVAADEAALVEIAEEVADRGGVGDADEFEGGEGGGDAVGVPSFRVVDVVLDLLGVGAAVDEDFLDRKSNV